MCQNEYKPQACKCWALIDVDNFIFWLTFGEDYKMTKVLGIAQNIAWQTDVHGYTDNIFGVGLCDGQGEGGK